MVELGCLENSCAVLSGTEGSNPSLSANDKTPLVGVLSLAQGFEPEGILL